MKRRGFLVAGGACMGCVLAHAAYAQQWQAPARLVRPELGTDEGGLWSMMDREETRLRRSPFTVRDPALRDYVQGIACRVSKGHCEDVRVYLVNTPLFNASMAPNGMMQLWTGLLLRVENEAQLAAIIGHELGHYLERHSIERLRDAKARTAFGQFLGLFGLVGAVGQLALLASMFAYSREQEQSADRIGLMLMREAGYDPAEAATLWENLLLEIRARREVDGESRNPLFATHPAPEDRRSALRALASDPGGGATGEEAWHGATAAFRLEWVLDEVKRRQPDESLALMDRLAARSPHIAEYRYGRGEVYRARGRDGDLERALADLHAAAEMPGAPAVAHSALGLVYRARNQSSEARACFERYLSAAGDPPDAPLIRTYLAETRS